VTSPLLQYFTTLSNKRYNFRKKSLLNTKCVLISSTNFSEKFVILRSSKRETIKNILWSSRKISKYKLPKIIRQLGDELFHADRRRDRHDEANSAKCAASTKMLTTLLHTVSYCFQVDQQKEKVCLHFPFVFTPLTSCFLISSKCVLIKIRLKSEAKPSI